MYIVISNKKMNVLMNRIRLLHTKLKNVEEFREIPNILAPIPQLNVDEITELQNDVHYTPNEIYRKIMIYENDFMNGCFILWKPNSKSLIHDHPRNGCYFRPLTNGLKEYRYMDFDDYIIKTQTKELYCNEVQYIHDQLGFHSMENKTKYIVPSVHFYSPPKFTPSYLNDIVKGL